MPWQGQYPGQPWREEPSDISKEDRKLADDKEALLQMSRFEIKAFAKRVHIDITGCINHTKEQSDFVDRIDIASRYPEIFDS